jgi:hypothetical protein
MDIAPDKLPKGTTREAMIAVIKTTAWAFGEEAGYARAILEAISMGDTVALLPDVEPCPVNEISPTSRHILRHWGRCQMFGGGMGGIVQPAADIMDADVRMVHGFSVIASERESIREAEKGGTDA